ncbi:MAG: 3-phosphoshikimate 1-carboxyvinyltransferase [Phycisphaerales bacterium]
MGHSHSKVDYSLPLEQLPDPLPIQPLSRPFDTSLSPPGSKSITNRAYMLAALADGESRIIRPLRADDTDRLLDALCTLGATARWENEDVCITGTNGRFPRGGEVNLGDGGTPTRFMIAAACLASEPVTVDGSARMRVRPIAEGVDMLRELGADIQYLENEGRLPVRVGPSATFNGGDLVIGQTLSSQFVSALMLIGPWLAQGLSMTLPEQPTSPGYIQLTHDVVQQWSERPRKVRSTFNSSFAERPTVGNRIQLPHNPRSAAPRFWVDSDASSAIYWVAATLLTPRSNYHVSGIGKALWQPDLGAIEELMKRAEYPDFNRDELMLGGPKQFQGFEVDASLWPDGAVAVAACAALAQTPSHITGLHTLRVKECDRVAALETELGKVGCRVETTHDSIAIWPRTQTPLPSSRGSSEQVVIETYNDHRMAMAFAMLGLRIPGIAIRNPEVVRKSYPGFWSDFATLYR